MIGKIVFVLLLFLTVTAAAVTGDIQKILPKNPAVVLVTDMDRYQKFPIVSQILQYPSINTLKSAVSSTKVVLVRPSVVEDDFMIYFIGVDNSQKITDEFKKMKDFLKVTEHKNYSELLFSYHDKKETVFWSQPAPGVCMLSNIHPQKYNTLPKGLKYSINRKDARTIFSGYFIPDQKTQKQVPLIAMLEGFIFSAKLLQDNILYIDIVGEARSRQDLPKVYLLIQQYISVFITLLDSVNPEKNLSQEFMQSTKITARDTEVRIQCKFTPDFQKRLAEGIEKLGTLFNAMADASKDR